jgi:redox-sensitive bicupin YhaK (pirin superfamily)
MRARASLLKEIAMALPIVVRRASETKEGAGVDVRRLMPVPGGLNYDPFVFWDHFAIGAGTGFPEHSRGFEAVTYVFARAVRTWIERPGRAQCCTSWRKICTPAR